MSASPIGIIDGATTPDFFSGTEDQSQVLILIAWQAFYLLSHLPKPPVCKLLNKMLQDLGMLVYTCHPSAMEVRHDCELEADSKTLRKGMEGKIKREEGGDIGSEGMKSSQRSKEQLVLHLPRTLASLGFPPLCCLCFPL